MGKRPKQNPIERRTDRRGAESRGAPRLPAPKHAQSTPAGPIPGGSAHKTATLGNTSSSHRQYILALLLVAWTAASFWRLGNCDFVNYYDDTYVYQNPHVRAGLNWGGIAWAFRSNSASNWHPLAWVSHMLDVQWFDLKPGRHHLVNLVLHCQEVKGTSRFSTLTERFSHISAGKSECPLRG